MNKNDYNNIDSLLDSINFVSIFHNWVEEYVQKNFREHYTFQRLYYIVLQSMIKVLDVVILRLYVLMQLKWGRFIFQCIEQLYYIFEKNYGFTFIDEEKNNKWKNLLLHVRSRKVFDLLQSKINAFLIKPKLWNRNSYNFFHSLW